MYDNGNEFKHCNSNEDEQREMRGEITERVGVGFRWVCQCFPFYFSDLWI